MLRYLELTGDRSRTDVLRGQLRFLAGAIAPGGGVSYDCSTHHRKVVYNAAVVRAALRQAEAQGFGSYGAITCQAEAFVIERQRADGGFPFSTGDYRLLSDRRSYPRYQAMILYHLLHPLTGSAEKSLVSASSLAQEVPS